MKTAYRDDIGPGKKHNRHRRLRLLITGAVQGVGFRPFVYRLATEMGLGGWVSNSAQGVSVEVEGLDERLREFARRLRTEKPSRSSIIDCDYSFLSSQGCSGFAVRDSVAAGEKTAIVLPDIATCPECVREIFDPANRRYRYPFTNCTDCGPRFSILESLPYDRANTTMSVFPMCDECWEEYENPEDRRFHAQPNACPVCGPRLELWNSDGRVIATDGQALRDACMYVMAGRIVALKGLGGFQLLVDAGNDDAIQLLRKLKARPDKPFAIMYPDPAIVRAHYELSNEEMETLVSPESPILLVKRGPGADRGTHAISRHIAPGNPYLGIMLPYTPLHHLLMAKLQAPVVATSGNLADEPICIDEREALVRLHGLADMFLVHNRPIARQMDDSVVQVVAGDKMILRSARGFAPVTVPLGKTGIACLAVGAHQKNTVAVSNGKRVFLSQHLGDLTTKQAHEVFAREATSLAALYQLTPEEVCCDEHPDYHSTTFAVGRGQPVTRVQHHFAHVASCMAEHNLASPVLGVSWDGTGLGTDGTLWGGEFLRVVDGGFERVTHLRPFSLPGGDIAVREPRRSATGLLYEILGDDLFMMENIKSIGAFNGTEKEILRRMLERKVNTPRTSSAGRLFDAVASIIGICQTTSFTGQAAMQLQFAAEDSDSTESYHYHLFDSCMPSVLDWQPMIHEILRDLQESVAINVMAAKFHRTLVEMILAVAGRAGEENVVLTGGCFQNRLLTEQSISALRAAGFKPCRHRRIPANDGGIALGQIYAATIRSTR